MDEFTMFPIHAKYLKYFCENSTSVKPPVDGPGSDVSEKPYGYRSCHSFGESSLSRKELKFWPKHRVINIKPTDNNPRRIFPTDDCTDKLIWTGSDTAVVTNFHDFTFNGHHGSASDYVSNLYLFNDTCVILPQLLFQRQ